MVLKFFRDAVAFCESLKNLERAAGRLPEGFRYHLPNGNEWLRFAQCGTNRTYPLGDSMPPTYGNYADETIKQAYSYWMVISGYMDGHVVSAPVEQSGRNEWEMYGVGGNVWEWASEQSGL